MSALVFSIVPSAAWEELTKGRGPSVVGPWERKQFVHDDHAAILVIRCLCLAPHTGVAGELMDLPIKEVILHRVRWGVTRWGVDPTVVMTHAWVGVCPGCRTGYHVPSDQWNVADSFPFIPRKKP